MSWQANVFRMATAAWITLLFACGTLFAQDDALPGESATAVQPSSEASSTADERRPPPSADQISAWIAELDSNRYLTRERATQNLLASGVAAVESLFAAANGDRPEPADRAIWVLQQLGESDDYETASAALNRLAAVAGHPAVADDARQTLKQLRERICQRKLAKLGARLAELEQVLPDFGHVQFVHVVLGADWQGTADDLQCLSTLSHRQFFRLDGAAIGDNEVMMFAEKDDLLYLQLIQTRVTPAAVDAIKLRQPKATVYIRNQALLGIEGGNHLPQGVFVKTVPPGTGAAAAGIMPGDVITHLGDEDVPDFDRLTAHIGQCQPGKEITVTLIRGGDRLTKQVTLGQWPDAP